MGFGTGRSACIPLELMDWVPGESIRGEALHSFSAFFAIHVFYVEDSEERNERGMMRGNDDTYEIDGSFGEGKKGGLGCCKADTAQRVIVTVKHRMRRLVRSKKAKGLAGSDKERSSWETCGVFKMLSIMIS